jgi:pimeloyl-ACP methyl ester carboxylesterase
MRIFKIVKKIPGLTWLEKIVKKHVGSTDYRNASDTMRKILVRHVNLDLTDDLSKVKCPTLLIWGTNDTQVDYEDAVKLEQLINNCGLVTYEGCTHYAYLERLNQTINVLKSFIGSEEK